MMVDVRGVSFATCEPNLGTGGHHSVSSGGPFRAFNPRDTVAADPKPSSGSASTFTLQALPFALVGKFDITHCP